MPMEKFNKNMNAIFHQRTRTHLVETNQGTHLVQTKSKDKESSKNTGRVIKCYLLEKSSCIKYRKVCFFVHLDLIPLRLNWPKKVREVRWTV